MKIHELYNNKKTISFEIFPPKTVRGEENLWKEMKKIAEMKPGFISVTYGAGGSTREKTLDIALQLKNNFNITPLVHFTCVGSDKNEIAEYIKEVKDKGINNILALRGDPPAGEKQFTAPENGFAHANELVEYLREIDNFTIAVAGYPEGHMEAPNLDTDIDNLKRKIDAGADLVITQLFYNNNDFYNFMDKTAANGISIPIIPGIMPVTSLSQVKKITDMCGASIPDILLKTLQNCNTEEDICKSGLDYSVIQCEELLDWGARGFHFYTLNKAAVVQNIINQLEI